MSAMLCSKPHNTNSITGQKLISSFPDTLLAANAAHTAIHTRILHNTPLINASEKLWFIRDIAAATTFCARSPLYKSGTWEYTTITATKPAPIKFPRNTKNQFLSMPATVVFFCRTLIIIRLFPVKSSLPATRTIAIPAGNTHALTSLATEAEAMVAEAVVEAIPAKPMNIPAKKPSISIFHADSLTL